MQIRSVLPALLALLALAACASPEIKYYTIATLPGPTANRAPRVVVLRGVALAQYLDRQPIVRSSVDYRLEVEANDWWGEPLRPMLDRVLVEELSQRLPVSAVYTEGGAVSTKPDVTIELNILRLDGDASGNLVLSAQAALVYADRRPPVSRSFRFVVPQPQSGTRGEVIAISSAIAKLADGLAVMVAP